MNHYDDDALMKYADGTSPVAGEIRAHVAICADCAAALAGHNELANMLRTARVWEESGMLRAVPAPAVSQAAPSSSRAANGLRDLAAVGRRLDAEDEVASKIVDELLATPQAWRRTKAMRGAAHTIGVVRQLLSRVQAVQSSSPLDALDVTTLAVDIADELPLAQYPSDLVYATRAHAARDHAYVLYLLGRMPEALASTERADDLFHQTALPDYELARVDIMRAQIYGVIDRVPEGIALARRAAETFRNFGDKRRAVNAQVSTATMLFKSSSHREALAIWESLLNEPAIEDVTRIMVTNNIAMCCREMGEFDRAIRYLMSTIAEFEILGQDLLRAKSRWSLATTLVSAGRTEDAIPILDLTWKEFESHGMESDAALVALELAEALLLLGRPERVPQICRTILDRFTAAGMTSRAITALAFLREAVAIGQARPTLVRHVHDFLRELPASSGRAADTTLPRLED